MKQGVTLFVASLAMILLPFDSRAQNDDPVVVTATRTPRTADESLASVTVITRNEIEAAQAKDVADLLRFHAGIDIGRNGGAGQPVSAFIRGADSNHTLVLVDGVRINPGTIGGAALQNISPDVIERIEIVRGPRSTLYGSDAVGGVVQIFTRRAHEGLAAHARAGAGTDETRDGGASAHYGDGMTRFGVDVSRFRTDGFAARVDGTQDSGYRNTTVSAYAGLGLGFLDAELSHWQARGNVEYLGFLLDPLDQDFTNTATNLSLKAVPAANWTSTIRLGRMRDEIDQSQSADVAHTRRTSLDWQNDVQWRKDHLATAGLYVAREETKAVSFGTGFDIETDIKAVYAQDQWHSGNQQILAALRYTDHDAFGGHTTGELAYGYRVAPGTQLRASVATAFRAPDTTDRFGFGGNPDLDPETSRNVEVGARFGFSGTQSLNIALFQNEIDDLILFVDPDGFTGVIPGANQNIEEARIRGVEIGYALSANPWTLNIEAIVQDPRNIDTGRQLARRAKRSLTAGVRHERGPLLIGLDGLATSARPDSDFSEVINPGYGIVNFLTQYRLARDWIGRARVENVLDKEYTLADGFNTQGRAVFAEIEYRYNP